MIDNFALGLSHGLMLIAAWLLLWRNDLDREPSPGEAEDEARPWRRGSHWGGRDA